MKNTIRIIAIFLCLIMAATSLTSCFLLKPKKVENTDQEHTNEVVEDTEPTPEPESTPENYEWVVEPMNIEGDIQPVYNIMTDKIHPIDVCFLEAKGVQSIISYDGSILSELSYDDFNYCGVCECITNHTYCLTEPNYTQVESMIGHGGGVATPYIYDKDTGNLYAAVMGSFEPRSDIDRAIVSICAKYLLTEEERGWYDTDYGYRNEGGYGIVVNGELVQEGFDLYTAYSCGVVAMRSIDGKWGYYDAKGNEILPCEYGASAIQIYDENGNIVNVPYHATEGILTLNRNGKWGYADTRGNMLTDFEFEEARPVINGKAWVKTAEGWGVIALDYFYSQDSEEATADHMCFNRFMV